MKTMARLVFPKDEVRAIVSHAKKSNDFFMGFGARNEETRDWFIGTYCDMPPAAGLLFVHDKNGVFLMSNGFPQPDLVCYPEGFSPKDPDFKARAAKTMGEEEFADFIGLESIEQVLNAAKRRTFSIAVTAGRLIIES